MNFYKNLEPLQQFECVLMLATACVLLAVVLREYIPDREIRLAGRLLGFVGFVLLGAFGWRMAYTVENLQTQIARARNATEISNNDTHVADRATDSETAEATIETPNGTIVSVRGTGAMRFAGGRPGRSSDRPAERSGGLHSSSEHAARASHAILAVPDDESVNF